MNPARRIALADLPAEWFHCVTLIRCCGARSLADDPKSMGKLRGAWGEQLKATASDEAIAGEPCPWTPPCALDVFFRPQARLTPALEVPKPYVLALLPDGGDLLVRLTIFGFATDWTEAAVEALVRACRTSRHNGRVLEVVDRRYWSEDAVAVTQTPTALVLAFETPLDIRDRRRIGVEKVPPEERGRFKLDKFVATLGNRVSGLARWQDAEADGDFRALKSHAAGLDVHELSRVPDRWTRFSRRQEQWIPMAGRRAVVLVEGDLAPLMPLLAIGETCHAGSHASLGLGRYRMLVPE